MVAWTENARPGRTRRLGSSGKARAASGGHEDGENVAASTHRGARFLRLREPLVVDAGRAPDRGPAGAIHAAAGVIGERGGGRGGGREGENVAASC